MRVLQFVLLLGSTRVGSDVMGPYGRISSAAGLSLASLIRARGHTCEILDPIDLKLPMLERAYHHYPDGEAPEHLERIATILRSADALVTVCGEYNHGVPPALLNLLAHFPRKCFDLKPVGIFTYSCGTWGGRMAASHLRTVLPELGMLTIPTLLSVADATADTFTTTEWHARATQHFLPELETLALKLK